MFGTLMIPIVVMKAKVFPVTRRPLFDIKVLREIPYDLFCISTFFGMMGLYIPFYYLSTYSIEKGIVDPNLGFYLLTIINAASVFGRIVPNYFADKVGPLNIMAPFGLLCGIVAFCWTSLHSLGPLIIFCISYGFFSGTYVAIVGPCLAVLSPDLHLVGTHMGMSFGFSAFGLVIGTPVAGALLENYGWIGPVSFCGICNILAGIFVLSARLVKTGPRVIVKA
jgi:MFS family permease